MRVRSSIRVRILCSSLSFAQRQVIRFGFPTTLVTIFLLLRPKDILKNDGADHHAKDEEPTRYEQTGKHTAEDTNGTTVI